MSSTRSIISPPVFAEDATTTIPPTPVAGVSYRDPTAGPASSPDGWPYAERVNSAEWNQLVYQWSSLLGIIDSRGILGWSDLVDYTVPSIVFGSNGLHYLAIAASGPSTAVQDPISAPTFWTPMTQHGLLKFETAGVSSFTVPISMQLGIIKPMVTVIGGGGGGGGMQNTVSGAGGGGGGGGGARDVIDLTGITSVSMTIGTGGAGGQAGNGWTGLIGGTTSFGAYLAASGGFGGSGAGTQTTPLALSGAGGGIGTTGTMKIRGNGGGNGVLATLTASGGSYGGNGGGAAFIGGGVDGGNGVGTTGTSPGEGGSGAGTTNNAFQGGSGAPGAVYVEW